TAKWWTGCGSTMRPTPPFVSKCCGTRSPGGIPSRCCAATRWGTFTSRVPTSGFAASIRTSCLPPDSQHASMSPSLMSARRLILIADADPAACGLYRTALQANGFETDDALDGRDALAKVFALQPAAIVLAADLAFIDGCELCRLV